MSVSHVLLLTASRFLPAPRRCSPLAAVLAVVLGTLTGTPVTAEPLGDDPAVAQFATEVAARHNFDAESLRRQLAVIEPNEAVLQAIRPAATAERKSWQRYRSRFLTPQRIDGGVRFWRAHAAALQRAEERFGVPPAVIVAIIGVETEYGRNTGRFSALQALATLAFRYPPRADFFREELEQLLLLAREQQQDVQGLRSSYAGAIGIPQFMPGSIRRFAVDFDEDGRIDLTASADDAIGSVAAFLAAHGWEANQPVAVRARLGDVAPEPLVEAGIRPSFTKEQLTAMGLTVDRLSDSGSVALIDLVTPDAATEFWWAYQNFYAITRYNRSNSYAMAVHQLSEAIARGHAAAPRRRPVKAARASVAKTATAGSRGKHHRGG